jgi:hypothetical protein
MTGLSTELTALLAKARSKLKTARIDFDSGQYDDAVSRAYYAVFHAMTAALLGKGLSFSSHGQVIGAFNREFLKTNTLPKYFSAYVQSLFDERQMGDYDPMGDVPKETAQMHITNAETILQSIETLLVEGGFLRSESQP